MTGIYYGFARVHPSTSTPLPTPSLSHSDTASFFNNPQAAAHSSQSANGTGLLSPEAIAEIPGQTAPYPPDSVPGEGEEKPKRLEVQDARVWPMVMSVGWNPYFKNEKITAVRRVSICTRRGEGESRCVWRSGPVLKMALDGDGRDRWDVPEWNVE